jgi:type IV secretory pathway VirB9-like protein
VQTPVGLKTCIEFRADIGSTNLPALLLLGSDGTWFTSPTRMVVNYSYQRRRFIVDELVNRAELVNGVEGERQRVRITREATP